MIALVAVVPALLQIVDGVIPQLRMHLSKGYLGHEISVIKPMILLAIIACVATRGIQTIDSPLTRLWALFVTYIIALSIFNSYRFNSDLKQNLISFVDTYGVITFLPFAITLLGVVPERPLRAFMILSFVPLAILGLDQYLSNDFIVYSASIDETYFVNSPSAQGHVRAFSLFGAPLKFGYYLAYIIVLLIFVLGNSRNLVSRAGCWLLLGLAAATLFTTITRNAYIFTLQMSVAAVLIRQRSRHIKYLPFWLLASSLLFTIAAATFSASQTGSSSTVLSGDSMGARLAFWRQYSYLWLMDDPLSILFGTGLSQYSRFNLLGDVVIDNFFISVGNQTGVIGLVLVVALLWRMWTFLLEYMDDAFSQSNFLCLAGIAFWSTFLAAGMLNTSFPVHITFFFLIMLCLPKRSTPFMSFKIRDVT